MQANFSFGFKPYRCWLHTSATPKLLSIEFPDGRVLELVQGERTGQERQRVEKVKSFSLIESPHADLVKSAWDLDIESDVWVEWTYEGKQYKVLRLPDETPAQLCIQNSQGVILQVIAGESIAYKRFYTYNPPKVVNVSKNQFLYDLIKTALGVLDLQERAEIIREQALILVEKDQQIAMLSQQLQQLDDRLQLTEAQRKELHTLQQTLQAELSDKEQAIAQYEQHIASLQTVGDFQSASLEACKLALTEKLSAPVWERLSPEAQQLLSEAWREYHLIEAEASEATEADYSSVGHKLGLLAEAEICHPFFLELKGYLQALAPNPEDRKFFTIGGLDLLSRRQYTLGKIPVLLSPGWDTIKPSGLNRKGIATGYV